MALTEKEQLVLEALKNMLDDDALGVKYHKDGIQDDSHAFTFLHEEVEQLFRLKAINLLHHDAICSAFSKIHSHKYLNDVKFTLAFKKEMTARAVPLEEQVEAIEIMNKIVEKLLGDKAEQDAGWNQQMDELIKVSQPPQIEESKDIKLDNINIRNSITSNKTIWRSIQEQLGECLKSIGGNCDTPEKFWETYDNPAVSFIIEDDLRRILRGHKTIMEELIHHKCEKCGAK